MTDPRNCVYTPKEYTRAFVKWAGLSGEIPQDTFHYILDPYAGRGDMLRAARSALIEFPWFDPVESVFSAFEIRQEEYDELLPVADAVTIGDWHVFGSVHDGLILSNPPYVGGDDRRTAEVCIARAEWVALFMQLPFLGTQGRSEWIRKTPLRFVVISPSRPSFIPSEYARRARVEEFARAKREGHAKRGDPNKWGTNACEYAFFVWQRDYVGRPEIDWLDIPT